MQRLQCKNYFDRRKITSVIGLPTTSLLDAVENKILNPSEIVSKAGYGAEI